MEREKTFLMRYYHHFITNFKKRPGVFSIGLLVLFVFFFFFFKSGNSSAEETIKPTKGEIIQTVKISGKVKASSEASMAFQKSGPITYLGVRVGEVVRRGAIIARISSGDENANFLQARASLLNVEANLNQLKQGARPEEIAIKEQTLNNAQSNLDAIYSSLPDSIHNVDQTTADIVKGKLANFFSYSGGSYYLSFSSCDQKAQSAVESNRTSIDSSLLDFEKSASLISVISSKEDIDSTFNKGYLLTGRVNDLISSISSLLLSSCSAQNTSLDSYRTNLALTRPAIISLFSDITSKRTTLVSAKNTFLSAQKDLDLIKAGTDQNKILAQEASVSEAEAKLSFAQSDLDKTIIYAPFDGTVTEVDVVEGETAIANNTVIKLISSNNFEVEAKVPEIDIAKVTVGDPVNVTLDTYGANVIFEGTISRIDPTATLEGNVPMYKVTISFDSNDTRIRVGMTSNVTIITEKKENALSLPIRFIKIDKENGGTVTLKTSKGDETKEVSIGIIGETGLVEITGGLTENDEVVAIQPGDRSAQKQTK